MKRSLFFLAVAAASLFFHACGSKNEITVYPVKIGEHWGYVNEKGKYIVNPTFESADYFSCGVARYTEDGKLGYINPRGKNAIDPIYARGTTFSEDKAFVVRDGEALECINTSGKVLFTLEGIEWAYNFHEGLSQVIDADGKAGYINEKGEIVIDLQYVVAGDYSEGLAYAQTEDKSGYIDKKGAFVFQTKSDKPYKFSEGLAVNNVDDGEYGYISKKGSIEIPFQFDAANGFKEGLACVKTGGKYGYINKKGNYVINPQYDFADTFSEGLATARIGRKFGYINPKGKTVIDPIYAYACDFVGGYAFVKNSDDKYGIINKKGDFVVIPQFTEAKDPSEIIGIRSGKFNGKEFVPEFLKRYTNDGWDGLNGTTTLKSIRSLYKKAKASGDNDFVCDTSYESIDGVKVTKMLFGFGEKTYKVVKNYTSFWGYTYENGTKRQYIDALPLRTLQYTFSLEGNALLKAKSVAEALAKGISEEYGVEPVIEENSFVLLVSEKSPKTTITWTTNNVIMTLDYAELTNPAPNANNEV